MTNFRESGIFIFLYSTMKKNISQKNETYIIRERYIFEIKMLTYLQNNTYNIMYYIPFSFVKNIIIIVINILNQKSYK